LSRLRFLFALLALLTMACALAACGDGEGGSEADPQAVINDATLQGVESADLNLSLAVKATGDEGGDLTIDLSGPFQNAGKNQAPELDMTASVNGTINDGDVNFDGGLVLLPNSAYVNYQGTDYEVDPTTYSFVEQQIKEVREQGGAEEESASACQEALAEVDLGNFVEDLSNDGSADVDGTSTTKISGDLDVGGTLDTLIELSKDPACSGQLDALERSSSGLMQIPSSDEVSEDKAEVESSIKAAHVDLYVGDDNIVRRISAQLTIKPKESDSSASEVVDIAFDLSLGGVNEDQEISAPEGAKPLSDLFLKLGVNPIELLGLFQGEGGEGLENLLEGFSGTAGGSSGASPAEEERERKYMKCLQGVASAADLQRCAALQ
jgi:hypothetical protein